MVASGQKVEDSGCRVRCVESPISERRACIAVGVVQSGPTRVRSLARLVRWATLAERLGIASRARSDIDPGTLPASTSGNYRHLNSISNLICGDAGCAGRLIALATVR